MANALIHAVTSEADALLDGMSVAELWMTKIEERLEDEKEWRKQATVAVAAFEAKSKVSVEGVTSAGKPLFNIFHSNIQTLAPAVYSQTPVPDVRRRYGDKDKVARLAANICERSLQSCIDSYDFDHAMKRTVRAGLLAGRGVPRIRYYPKSATNLLERAIVEHVRWDMFVHGEAANWEMVPWQAFAHDMTKAEVWALIRPPEPEAPDPPVMPDPIGEPEHDEILEQEYGVLSAEYAGKIDRIVEEYREAVKKARDRLDAIPFGRSDKKASEDDGKDARKGILGTVRCWEIWDKASRSVIWVTEHDRDDVLKVMPDPLGLREFFPAPRPLSHVEGESTMTPVVPHDVYADLVAELDEVTARIKVVIKDMRVRGTADPAMQADLERLATAMDGEVISSTVPENFQRSGKSLSWSDLVMFWPVDQNVAILNALMQHREQLKQTTYEVTGISDILRGATSASETATAQNIKATWGSQRVQEIQAEVGRIAKDIFKMKSEIIFGCFSDETIRLMTLLPEPLDAEAIEAEVRAQAQAMTGQQPGMGHNGGPALTEEDVPQIVEKTMQEAQAKADMEFGKALAMMRDELQLFRVDIETDSTVRPDTARDQQSMNEFLRATSEFAASMAAIAQVLPAMVPQITRIYTALVRKTVRLGKSIEDVLDNLDDAAAQPPPAQDQGQGAEQAAEQEKAAMEAEQQRAEGEDSLADRQHKRDMEREGARIDLQRERNAGTSVKADAEKHRADRDAEIAAVNGRAPPDNQAGRMQ